MSYFLVSDFSSGLDVRKSPWTSANGSLQVLDDGQITRGGEIEKRKAFTNQGDLLATTHALVSAKIGAAETPTLVVFGSDAAPVGLPAGVVYQQLLHPDGGIAMTDLVDYTLYNGNAYVVADFADGSQWHYYDGVLVTDWAAGVVRASMTTNDQIAEHLRLLIDADDEYSATRLTNQVTVVGPIGADYASSTETTNVTGGVNDQSLSLVELIPAVAEVPSVQSYGEFAIVSGSPGVGNYIDQIRVDIAGVFTDLIGASVLFDTSPELTGLAVVTAINAGTGTHGYTAETQYGRVIIFATAADGAGANGRILEVTARGNVILYSGGFTISGGTFSAGVNMVTSVKANGVEILGASVNWTGDNATTAAAVATQIRAFASVPKYNAYSEGETVFCSPEKIRSDNATTITLVATSVGNVTFEPGSTPQVEDQYPDYGEDLCVAIDSYLPTGIAGDVMVGSQLELSDPVDPQLQSMGEVTRSDRGMKQCYRITTTGDASLVCSDSAPIPVRAGGYRHPAKLIGHEVAVRRAAGIAWESVTEVFDVGHRAVQMITVGDRCFWAGEKEGIYLLHHNRKPGPGE